MNSKIRYLLETCLPYIEEWANEECDHSVNMCYCSDRDLLKEINEILAEDQSSIIKQQLDATFKLEKVTNETKTRV